MSGESDTSMVTWKSESAAGLMETSGVGVQTVVSCLTEAETERRRQLWWRRCWGFSWRKRVEEGKNLVWRGAWEVRWG